MIEKATTPKIKTFKIRCYWSEHYELALVQKECTF